MQIAVVAVMCKPHRCPHIAMTGNICVYCPGGPDSDFEYSTQSYTGYEPTSMRAIRARYNPYEQARQRLDQLRSLGHTCDKVEYIIMGGTFMSMPEDYRDWFIKELHDALSGMTSHNVDEAVKYVLLFKLSFEMITNKRTLTQTKTDSQNNHKQNVLESQLKQDPITVSNHISVKCLNTDVHVLKLVYKVSTRMLREIQIEDTQ